MSKWWMQHLSIFCITAGIVLITAACSAAPASVFKTPSALNPHGSNSAHIASLTWLMVGIGTPIFLMVVGLMVAALLRRQRGNEDTAPDKVGGDTGRSWVIRGGI